MDVNLNERNERMAVNCSTVGRQYEYFHDIVQRCCNIISIFHEYNSDHADPNKKKIKKR